MYCITKGHEVHSAKKIFQHVHCITDYPNTQVAVQQNIVPTYPF